MIGTPRISTRRLAGLCRRIATSLIAGIGLRSVWARDAQRAPRGAFHEALQTVANAIERGDRVYDALEETGDYFPVLFREVVHVGEHSGHLGETFASLADHYENQLRFNATFLASMVWPMIELLVAIGVVGLLIWAPTALTGQTIDILGIGLVGDTGLMEYLIIVAGVGIAVALLVHLIRRGTFWVRPVQYAMLYVPGVGPLLRTLALTRLAWAMHLTFDSGMDVRSALRLSLATAGNPRYSHQFEAIDTAIVAGDSLGEAFGRTGVFPRDFLDMLIVGEESGQLVESMDRLSRMYRAQADAAMRVVSVIAGFAIWGGVAAVIVALIFRIASFYLGALNNAAQM